MKKLILIVLSCACAVTFTAAAQDQAPAKKAAPGQEQKAIRKALIEKYDTDKNGRLKKAEIEQMTPEDKAQWNSIAEANKTKAAEAKEKAAEKKEAAAAKKAEAEAQKAAGQANKPTKKDK